MPYRYIVRTPAKICKYMCKLPISIKFVLTVLCVSSYLTVNKCNVYNNNSFQYNFSRVVNTYDVNVNTGFHMNHVQKLFTLKSLLHRMIRYKKPLYKVPKMFPLLKNLCQIKNNIYVSDRLDSNNNNVILTNVYFSFFDF